MQPRKSVNLGIFQTRNFMLIWTDTNWRLEIPTLKSSNIGEFWAERIVHKLNSSISSGSLNFATKNLFKTKLCEHLNIDLEKELQNFRKSDDKAQLNFKHLIVDFSGLSSIDLAAVSAMLEPLISSFDLLNIKVPWIWF